MPSVTEYPSTSSGYTLTTGTDWSSVVNATSADFSYAWNSVMGIMADSVTSPGCRINRGYLVFDTSSIPTNATITSLALNYNVSAISSNTTFKIFKSSTPTLATPLQNSDYDLTNFSTDYTYYAPGGITVNATGWNIVVFPALSLLEIDIVTLSEVTMVFRHYYDYTNTLPPGPSYNSIVIRLNNATLKPYLSINYKDPYGNKVNAVIPANISSINTVATEDVSLLDGV